MDEYDRICEELEAEVKATLAAGGRITAAQAARSYRLLTTAEPVDWWHANAHRRLLHAEAAEGNEFAAAVLELLADDPWWSSEPE